MPTIHSRYVSVDGIKTHYLEGGDGPTVVLLHSGEFGGAAELSWEFTLPALVKHFRVVAPDWLGFGRTDKVYDFAGGRNRVMNHMVRFLEVMAIDKADFVGNSMGGSNLARVACSRPVIFPLRSIVLCSGGGFAPDNDSRRTLLNYDCSDGAMKALLNAMFHTSKWADDAAYIKRRQELALIPGAWECTAAARFKSPAVPARSEFGAADTNAYEQIEVPTLIVAGANDKLREPGYANGLAKRIKDCELHVFENCGHCPNIEMADRFNEIAVRFLKRVNGIA
jgi:pimeloyl-ACP methyl ester carboxylesterase